MCKCIVLLFVVWKCGGIYMVRLRIRLGMGLGIRLGIRLGMGLGVRLGIRLGMGLGMRVGRYEASSVPCTS